MDTPQDVENSYREADEFNKHHPNTKRYYQLRYKNGKNNYFVLCTDNLVKIKNFLQLKHFADSDGEIFDKFTKLLQLVVISEEKSDLELIKWV